MLAPKVARADVEAAEMLAAKSAFQRSTPAAQPSRGTAAGLPLFLQRAIGNQADDPQSMASPQASSATAAAAAQPLPATVHYRFEIKAWIPFLRVPDPEEPLQEAGFRLQHSNWDVRDYASVYRGDAHAGYEGSYRVIQAAEFDWDGRAISNVIFPPVPHFGTSHRDFSASVRKTGSLENWRNFQETAVATTDHAVSGSMLNVHEIDLGMSSPNPLTIFPAPDIDADYSFFISQDTFNIETVTVRWTTDLMPNHGYRVIRNGVVAKEHIVNTLPGLPSSAEIFMRLNSKSNGGADSFEPGDISSGS